MEEGLGFAKRLGTVVKRKGASGCLIIKKKGDGIAGVGTQNLDKKIKKKIKKPRLILSDSDSSSEDSESPPRAKTEKIDYANSLSKKADVESERKRSGLDVFDFDEYDGYDVKKMKKDDRAGQSGKNKESLVGSGSKGVIDKKKPSHSSSKSGVKKRNDADDDSLVTISSLKEKYKEACNEPIRLQGKNGVLKVMVNKHKKLDSRSELVTKTSKMVSPSSRSDSKRTERRVSFIETDKVEVKSQKAVSTKRSTVKDTDTDVDIGTPRRLGSGSTKGCSSSKIVKKETKTNLGTGETALIKRSGSTEKQKLRDKIKGILLENGWTIDYRPRKNRDYIDNVYIAPNGSAYWSIVKAYDIFQKQQEEEDLDDMENESSELGHLSEEISKLTRQTKRKMEREMLNRSRDEDSEEKLSYYLKQNHKSRKRSHAGEVSGDEKPTIQKNSKSGKTGRCTLLVRRSETEANSDDNEDGFVPYTGKRTVLAWLIDSGTVRMSEKVQYMNKRKTRAMLEGRVTREGIHCGCCSKILTVSKFEIHAGSKQKQPFSNIQVESGVSLLECQIEAWNKQDESKSDAFHMVDVEGDDPNDDTCGLCGDGGDLICCDGCPSTFHQSCLNIETLPLDEWNCPNCACKFCALGGGTNAQAKGKTVDSLFTCNLCEKKYHGSCGEEIDDKPRSKNATTFCGETCQQLYGELWKLLGVKHELEEGFSWSLIHRMDTSSSSSDTIPHHQMVECNSKLAVALSVMDECFLPIVDRRSDVNVVQSVLYNCGSNFDRLNYKGFYTIVLERADEIISAASIRIRGLQLAEMPFIGTRHMYRRKGMCRRLFGAIESVLRSLKVEKLIIPAIAEHMRTWTEVFHFKPLQEHHKQEMRSFNMMVFPGVDMLHKQLLNSDPENVNNDSDTEISEMETDPLPATNNDASDDETKSKVSSEEESISTDAETKCSTPSNQSPLDLEISTPESADPAPVTDGTSDVCENADDASSAKLVLDDMEKAKENGDSTPTCTEENQDCPKTETENTDQDETAISSPPPVTDSKSDSQEKSGKDSCAELVLDNLEEAKENGDPISVSTLTEENHESPKKDAKSVHQDETAISSSLPVTDSKSDGQEKSGKDSCAALVLDNVEAAKENGDPISVSTLTEENHESPKKDAKSVHQDETAVSSPPLVTDSKIDGQEKNGKFSCADLVLDNVEAAKENGDPTSVSTLTEENHESPKKDTKSVHQDETTVSSSPALEGTTEPNILESRNSELSNEILCEEKVLVKDVMNVNSGTSAADEKVEVNDCDDGGKFENLSVSPDRQGKAEGQEN